MSTPPRHTKTLACECGCGREFAVSLDTIRVTDGHCLLRGFKRPRLVTPDLFDEATTTTTTAPEVALA